MVGQKNHLLTLNTKLRIQLTMYTDGIGTGYMSHDKEVCLHGKRLKNYFKINQSK